MVSVGIVIRSLFKYFYLSSIGFLITVHEGGCKMVFHLPFIKLHFLQKRVKYMHFFLFIECDLKRSKDLMIDAEYLQRHMSTRKKI